MTESDGERLARMGTDARAWAEEFMTMHRGGVATDADLALMMSWFAAAIETGRSAGMEGRLMTKYRVTYRKKSGGGMDEYEAENMAVHSGGGLICFYNGGKSKKDIPADYVAVINTDDILKVDQVTQ